ncbi:MFS transporter [Hymenobacter volaticus]|uniref:MFS transporter n=1 Tax=Hymenobacter volaticus TaxID=2932254 RepID=A0ABY4GGL0_9BACT|nr:MFS transporter [Hymenobacter volaticus]UOQ69938.1 MFS transporter [Hymenobacter volaticus]
MIPLTSTPELATNEPSQKPAWNAVFALALGVAGLITSEFLPVSLLTPMAHDLSITEGVAGQAISITAVVAMFASLLIAVATRRLDRRWVLLSFSVLQVVSNALVAFAPNFLVLTIGRVLLGVAIGGFWAMSAAVAMRLVPAKDVPKALSTIFGAVSVATVVAAPLGSFLGGLLGWRTVFELAAGLGALSFVWQALTLPAMAPDQPVGLGTLVRLLKRPHVTPGMLGTLFVFMGYATFFTYLRPFLETVTGVNVNTLTTILLGFGLANLAGTVLARHLLTRNLARTLTLMPLLMGLVVAGLVLFGQQPVVAAVLVAFWGTTFGVVQVGWPTWLTRTLPDEAESGGGLQVATTQLAITIGAAVGGGLFDLTGAVGVFIGSSVITLLAALVALLAFRKSPQQGAETTQPAHEELVARHG